MAPAHLTLSALERPKSRSSTFESLISRKGAELGPILLLNNVSHKPYVSQKSSLVRPHVIITINRKLCMEHVESTMTPQHLALGDLQSGFEWWEICMVYNICQQFFTTLIWVSQKRAYWQAWLSAVPTVFLVTKFVSPSVCLCSKYLKKISH